MSQSRSGIQPQPIQALKGPIRAQAFLLLIEAIRTPGLSPFKDLTGLVGGSVHLGPNMAFESLDPCRSPGPSQAHHVLQDLGTRTFGNLGPQAPKVLIGASAPLRLIDS